MLSSRGHSKKDIRWNPIVNPEISYLEGDSLSNTAQPLLSLLLRESEEVSWKSQNKEVVDMWILQTYLKLVSLRYNFFKMFNLKLNSLIFL